MAAVINPTSLGEVVSGTRPLVLARERTLPVLPALAGLVPDEGLARGAVVGVGGAGGSAGATSLALALAAGPSAAGSWVAVVGRPDLGLAAATEVGIDPDRLALVAEPPPDGWAAVVAALIGGVDVVVVAPRHPVRAADARRLAARARERGTVLVQIDGAAPRRGRAGRPAALELDLRLTVTGAEWQGVGAGHGHLRARRLVVEAGGRRAAARPRRVELWLPDHRGRIVAVPPAAGAGASTATSAGAGLAFAGSDIDRLEPPLREVG